MAALFRNEAFIDDVAKHANAIEHTVNIADDVTHLDLTLPAPESIRSRAFPRPLRWSAWSARVFYDLVIDKFQCRITFTDHNKISPVNSKLH